MRILFFIAIPLFIINMTLRSAYAQSQSVLFGQSLDSLLWEERALFHQNSKGVDIFDSHPANSIFRDSIVEEELVNSIDRPLTFGDDFNGGFNENQPMLFSQVEGLSVLIQGEMVVFQREHTHSLLNPKSDLGFLFNAMERHGIKTINSDASSTVFIPVDPKAEPVQVNKIFSNPPLPTGINLIDQNPAINRVNQQARKQLAGLLLAAEKLTDLIYSRNLEAPHINKIDNEDEETDIVFELGGSLYSTETLNTTPQEIKDREDRVELVYETEILTFYIPAKSNDSLLRELSLRVRKCSDDNESDEDESGEDESGEDKSGEDKSGEDKSGEDKSGEDKSGEDKSEERSGQSEAEGAETDEIEFDSKPPIVTTVREAVAQNLPIALDQPATITSGSSQHKSPIDSLYESVDEVLSLFVTESLSLSEHTHLSKEVTEKLEKMFTETFTTDKNYKKSSVTHKISFMLTFALLRKKLGMAESAHDILQELIATNQKLLQVFLDCLRLYKELSSAKPDLMDQDKVDRLAELAIKTKFAPALWMMIKLSMLPDGASMRSPGKLVVLYRNIVHPNISKWIIKIFSSDSEDFFYLNKRTPEATQETELHHILVMMARSVFFLPHPHLNIGENGFSDTSLFFMSQVMTGSGVSWGEAFNSAIIESRDAVTKKEKKRYTNFLQQGEQGLKDEIPNKSPYLQSIGYIVLGFLKKHRFLIGQEKPFRCAALFEKAALLKHFPGLLHDAAEIYMDHGRYDDACRCLLELMEQRISQTMYENADNFLELCYEKSTPEAIAFKREEILASYTVTQQTSGPKKKGHRKKKSNGKRKVIKPTKQTHQKTVKTKQATASALISEFTSTSLPGETQEAACEASEPELETKPETAAESMTELIPVGQPKGVKEATCQRFYTDFHPTMQDFLRKINVARDNGELYEEKQHLELFLTTLKYTGFYGRICIETCWFYYRQIGLPVFIPRRNIEGDKAIESEHQLAEYADKWAHKALSVYLDRPIPEQVNNGELKEIILQFYHENPTLAADPEFRKRIRSACSTLGHIKGKLAEIAPGKRRKKHESDAHEFYQLKQIADPNYKRPCLHRANNKISVISQEEFARLKQPD